MRIFENPREISAREASGLHRNGILRVKTDRGDFGKSYGSGVVKIQQEDGGTWTSRACSKQREMWRVNGSLDPAPAGVAIARRGAPDLVVAGEN